MLAHNCRQRLQGVLCLLYGTINNLPEKSVCTLDHHQKKKQPKKFKNMVKYVLILECTTRYNWYEIFENATLLSGEKIVVEQATWQEVQMTAYSDSKLRVEINRAKKPLPNTPQDKPRSIAPDFVLFRTLSQHVNDINDKNKFYAFQFSNVPTMNSMRAMYSMFEKPWVYGALREVQTKLYKEEKLKNPEISKMDVFPLIDQTYYPFYNNMIMDPSFPCVVKIGPFHAGYGKIKCESRARFDDVRSIVALHKDYCTGEKWIDWDYEVRIQKIGNNNIKCFKRRSMNWKGNVGNQSIIEDCPLTPDFQRFIDAASGIFGGMDICALDLVHLKSKQPGDDNGDEKEKELKKESDGVIDAKASEFRILEINGTAIGLVEKHAKKDMLSMRDLVILRMSKLYPNNDDDKKGANDNDNNTVKVNDNDENDVKTEVAAVTTASTTNEAYAGMENNQDDKALLEAVSKIRELERQIERTKQEKNNQSNNRRGNGKNKENCIVM